MIRVGQKLKEKRLEKGLTLEEVSQNTKIRTNFLFSIEKGDYLKLPSVAYAQGFVRNYARYLGLNESQMMALFRREFNEDKHVRVLPAGFAKDDVNISKVRSKGTFLLIFLTAVFLFGYIAFQYRSALFRPDLRVDSPKKSQALTVTRVPVSGKADPSSTVFVNEFPVSVNVNGEFKKTIVLFPGKSTITIKAVSRFGKENIIKREIEIKDP